MRKGLLNQMMSVAKRGVALLLFVCLVAQHCIVSEATNSQEGTETAVEVVENDDESKINSEDGQNQPKILCEIEEKRDEYIKQFLLEDGSFLVCQYAQPAHYLKQGQWNDIDNTLMEETTGQVFENTDSDTNIKFANKAKKVNMIRIKQGAYQVSWGILDAENKPSFNEIIDEDVRSEDSNNPTKLKKITSSGIYRNVFDGVDLRYTIVSKTVKEDIILNRKGTVHEFSFAYQLKGLEMRLTEENIIEVYDAEIPQNIIYVLDKPYMYDSADKAYYSDAISIDLSGKNGKYTVTLTANEDWLNADNRVYPVIIDPTIQPETNAYNIKDTTRAVNSGISSSARASLESISEKISMKVGYRYGSELQGLIHFNIPSVIPSSAKIINAQMALYYFERATIDMQVNAHLITSDWNTGNISDNAVLYGSETPTYDSNVIDFKIFSMNAAHQYYMFDITSAVQKWSTGICPNYGILLAAESYPQSDCYVRFRDSDDDGNCDPQYLFTYRDNKGLEDYWTYHTQSVGKAGTGYVNDFSGNLVFIHNDIQTTSERMTVSLDHVFDQSRLVDTTTYLNSNIPKYGNGWRLSAMQRLQETQSDKLKETYPYYYTDADGTEHFFKSNGNGTYGDEDGLGLTLSLINEYTDNNTTLLSYSITSKDKITMKFDSAGFLRRISDTTCNTISFHYTQGAVSSENNYLTSIEDPSGRIIYLHYNSSYQLISVQDFSGKYTTYDYNSLGQLIRISYSDGTSVLYSYDGANCLDIVKDVELTGSGRYTVDYNLYSYAPYRVQSITEYASDGQAGQSISNIVYEHNQTLFTDNKGRTSIYQFDNWGCTTSVIDSVGNASNYSYEHTGNKNYKFSTVGTSQKNINNYIMNSSGEDNSVWSNENETMDGSTETGTIGYNTEQVYLGNRSLYVSTESNTSGRVAHKQNLTLGAGTYTLSAYLKTQNVQSSDDTGAGLSVSYVDNDDTTIWKESKWTTETNDWQRITLTFTVEKELNTVSVYLGLLKASGSAYFDGVQLEDGEVANNYNLLQNGSFEQLNGTSPTYWTGSEMTGADIATSNTAKDGINSFKVTGSATARKQLSQNIPITGNEGDIYAVSGWAKGNSVGLTESNAFRITTKVTYSDGTEKSENHNFNACVSDWQFLSVMVSTDDKNATTQKIYTGISVSFCYYNNENIVYIDHFQVTKDNGQSYVYDDNGNLISTVDIADIESKFQYQNDNIKRLVNPDGSSYEYSYGCAPANLLLSARSSGGVSYKFGYNMVNGYGTTDVSQTAGDKYSATITPGKAYYIRNWSTGKNLQPYNCVSEIGSNIIQYEPCSSHYQKWWLIDAGEGYYYFELADGSRNKLSVKNSYAGANQPLELNTSLTDAEKFELIPETDGIHYSIRTKLNNTMAVCSDLGSVANNNQILLYPYTSAGPDRGWYFVEVTQSDYTTPEVENTYHISNHLTSQYFDIPAFRTDDGCGLTQHAFLGSENQQFTLEKTEEYILLVPKHCSSKAITVGSDGTSLTLQAKNASDTNQHHRIVELRNGAYRIIPRNYPNKSISQVNATATMSGLLYALNYEGEPWQEWCFTKPIDYTASNVPESGEIYYIRFQHDYYYLDVHTFSSEIGTNLSQFPLNSFLNQQFQLKETSDGYFTIRPMHTTADILLTMIPDAAKTDGSGYIQLQQRNDSVYQEFKFVSNSNGTYRLVCRASGSDAFCMEVPNGSYGYSEVVKYAPFVGNGASWQWLTLEKVGNVIRTSATYTDNRNYVTSITDASGHTTQYDYNTNSGVLNSVTDAKGNTIAYTYDSSERLSTVSTGNATVGYHYFSNSALQKINSPSGTEYNFTYDAFGNVKTVSVGSRQLIEHFYQTNNGTLAYSIYGNGAKTSYIYDSFDYLKQKLYNDVVVEEYLYDALGRLYSKKDILASRTTQYEYDFNDRIAKISSSDGLVQSYQYDTKNRIASYTNTIDNIEQQTAFVYNQDTIPGTTPKKDGYLYGITVNDNQTLAYEYDSLSRLKAKRIDAANHYKVRYEYYQGIRNTGTSQTTTLIGAVVNGNTRLEYTYDELNNITSISKNGAIQESYTYDYLNQLKTVTRGVDVWEYTYDNGGNITEVKKNGTTIKSYTYGDSEWKDLLTAYNGQGITYDAIGNPLQYRDGYNFTWANGRKLASATNGSNIISYAYNADGLRISKNVNGTVTEYYRLDDCLLGQKTGDEYILYLYDENGTAYGMILTDGTTESYYYYQFNVQGDVIGILDANGTQVVEYTYGAWGEILSITGSMADTIGQKNPLRYRGYYYDAETGLYYVSSRYYDPEIGRWINADNQIAGVGGEVLGYNMFAYCMNNPVNMSDPSGNWPKWATKLVAAVAVVAVVAVVAAVTVATAGAGTAIAAVAVGAAKGAAIGFAVGAATGAAGGAISHRISTGSWDGAGEAALNGMANGALSGAVSGAITGGITGGLSYNSGATSAGKGFDTYRQLKNEIGSPGAGNEWHHIVEQSQIAKSGFSPQMIQNTNNIMSISKTTHRAISGYYSSVQPFTNGMIVRNWLAGQSFSAQYEFGINVIKMFM